MKQVVEPPFPATFWPHAFLQMLAFVGYMLLLEPMNLFPSLQIRVGELGAVTGWGLPLMVWIVYVFLIVERLIRQSQLWAAALFPFRYIGFVVTTTLMLVPLMFVSFVALECVLYFVALGRYPMQFGTNLFQRGFVETLKADAPLLLLLFAGELLRQFVYRAWISKWHYERGLRLLPEYELRDQE